MDHFTPAPYDQRKATLSTFVKLMRAAESVSAAVHRHLAAKDLSISQFGILEALHHLGPMCQKDIARKILKSAGNITMVIDNLQRRGLVTRERDRKDRRYSVISLTDKGKTLIEKIFPLHAEQVHQRMSCLSGAELQQLSDLLKKLGIGPLPSDPSEVAGHAEQPTRTTTTLQ